MGLDFETESRELLGESALVPYTVCVSRSPWEEAGVVCSPPLRFWARAFSSIVVCMYGLSID